MKKSQIKFGESIGVIVIVYIVVLIGLLWFNNVNAGDLNEMFERDENQRAYEKFQYIDSLDLIHVTQRGIVEEDFDLQGLYSMGRHSNSTNGSLFFRKQLGESIISVDLYDYNTYDKTLNVTETIILYNYTRDERKKDKVIYKTPIPIFDEISERYIIGLLNVEVPLR